MYVVLYRVARVVAPKKAKLKEAEAELKVAMEVWLIFIYIIHIFPCVHMHTCLCVQSLNKKRADLHEVQQKLADLQAQFNENTAKKEQLERDVDMCSKKLDRYGKTCTWCNLLHTPFILQGWEVDWWPWRREDEMVTSSQRSQSTIWQPNRRCTGIIWDCSLSWGIYICFPICEQFSLFNLCTATALSISLQDQTEAWCNMCVQRNIPCSSDFSLTTTLGQQVCYSVYAHAVCSRTKEVFSISHIMYYKCCE